MSFFTWQERFDLGIPEIDRDHKILADLIVPALVLNLRL
jgi:hemerythrin